jgi:hypothetical protein
MPSSAQFTADLSLRNIKQELGNVACPRALPARNETLPCRWS